MDREGDVAIANAETVEEVRHTLTTTPDAHEYLQEGVQADRKEHVTTKADVKQNQESYFNAKRAERAYQQLPLHKRVRANLPNRFGGIDHPLNDIPASEGIDGPRDIADLSKAVKKRAAADQRARGKIFISDPITTAEEATDTAVESAITAETLQQRLRETPGAHKGFLYALETPNAHTAHEPDHDQSESLEQTNQRKQTFDQDSSLGL
jgi:hypothetical protein